MIALMLVADLLISGTVVTLRDTTEPGAIAEVVLQNWQANGPDDDGSYSLSGVIAGGRALDVGVVFTWDSGVDGADRITVIPPDGVACRPASCVLELPEGQEGRLFLFDWVGF